MRVPTCSGSMGLERLIARYPTTADVKAGDVFTHHA
jgi:hypothetical protein